MHTGLPAGGHPDQDIRRVSAVRLPAVAAVPCAGAVYRCVVASVFVLGPFEGPCAVADGKTGAETDSAVSGAAQADAYHLLTMQTGVEHQSITR